MFGFKKVKVVESERVAEILGKGRLHFVEFAGSGFSICGHFIAFAAMDCNGFTKSFSLTPLLI